MTGSLQNRFPATAERLAGAVNSAAMVLNASLSAKFTPRIGGYVGTPNFKLNADVYPPTNLGALDRNVIRLILTAPPA